MNTCCPRLNAQEKSPYPRIQYSQIPENQSPPSDVDNERITDGRRRHRRGQAQTQQEETHHDAPRPKMRFALPQAGSSAQYSVHPQLGVALPHSRVLTEQPSPSPDYFKQRFDLSTEISDSYDQQAAKATTGGDAGIGHKAIHYSVPGLPVYREKAVSSLTSSREAPGDPDNRDAIVQFSLHYDIQQSKLRVHLQYATNLPKAYVRGSPIQCDPFVMLHLEPDREDTFQSNVVRCTYDPVFNQTFQFGGLSVDNIRLQTLVFRFYNHALSNKAIGKACLQLRDVDLFGVVVQMKIIGSEEMEVRTPL